MFKVIIASVLFGLIVASKDWKDDSNEDSKEHSIELPIKSKHSLEILKVPSHREESSTKVDIPSGVLPVYMLFKTQSSPIYVKQQHTGTKGSYQKSDSKDEPHTLVHEVVKPVIQELKEIITPYRKVTQIIEKVSEERQTKVHKNDGKDDKNDDNDDDDNKKYGSIAALYKRYGMSSEW